VPAGQEMLPKNDNGAIRHLTLLNLRAREMTIGPLLAPVSLDRPPKGAPSDADSHLVLPKTARIGLAYGTIHRQGQTAFAVWRHPLGSPAHHLVMNREGVPHPLRCPDSSVHLYLARQRVVKPNFKHGTAPKKRPELALPMDCSIGKARQSAPSGLGKKHAENPRSGFHCDRTVDNQHSLLAKFWWNGFSLSRTGLD